MKRSEMINAIRNAVGMPCTYVHAEEILSKIERMGMLPPEYLDRKADMRFLEWEPENETK